MGRKAIPSKLKLLRGNPGKRPLPEHEPEPEVEIPEPPEWMKGFALREWKRLTPILEAVGLMTGLDRGIVILNCVAWGLIEEYSIRMKRTSPTYLNENGVLVYSADYHVLNKAWTQYYQTSAVIGLTPSSRTGIEVADIPSGKKKEGSYKEFRERHKR